ncbi:MAG: DUF3276 family protein [Treponema sp.]|nr:DUF3276 family protein [Treponema sp.]
MGIRGELFSTKVSLQNRTYFFNVKENRMGDLYLNIVESKNKETGGFERQSIVLFAEDLQEFLKGFDGSLKVLEKAYKDKKRTEFEKKTTPEKEIPKKVVKKHSAGSSYSEGSSVRHKGASAKNSKKPVIRTYKKDNKEN